MAGRTHIHRFALTALMLAYGQSVDALCIYNGKHFERSGYSDFDGRLYAKTTLRDEFADSALVIRGTVLSSHDIQLPHSDPGFIYRIRVDRVFKGKPPKTIRDYTERDSGGFYLDGGSTYLLFLDPIGDWFAEGKSATDVMVVNYNCGQSRPWTEVPPRDRQLLEELSRSK